MIWRVARRPVDSTQWHKLASKSRGHPLQCTCLVQKSVANYLNDSYFYRRGERECVRNYLIHTKPLWKSRSRRPASKQDPTEAIPFFLLPDRIHFYILRGNQIAKLNHHVKEQKNVEFSSNSFPAFPRPQWVRTPHKAHQLSCYAIQLFFRLSSIILFR